MCKHENVVGFICQDCNTWVIPTMWKQIDNDPPILSYESTKNIAKITEKDNDDWLIALNKYIEHKLSKSQMEAFCGKPKIQRNSKK